MIPGNNQAVDRVRWRMLGEAIADELDDEIDDERQKLTGEPPGLDVPRTAAPSERPHPAAQWDEAAGRWEIWSDEAGGWVSTEDGTVQAPASRSVPPTESSILWPPSIEAT